jgi:hypothetical protein
MNAFLNASLEEAIYVEMLHGFTKKAMFAYCLRLCTVFASHQGSRTKQLETAADMADQSSNAAGDQPVRRSTPENTSG